MMRQAVCLLFISANLCAQSVVPKNNTSQTPALAAIEVQAQKPPQPARPKPVPAWKFDRFNVDALQASLPGVSILARQNEVQDAPIIVRGFGARAAFGTRGVRLLVDGIPQSGADGQGQLGALAPGSHANLRWLVGPAATVYGFNAAAVLQADTWDSDQPMHEAKRRRQLQASGTERGAYKVQFEAGQQSTQQALRVQLVQIEQQRARDYARSTRQQLQLNARGQTAVGDWRAHTLWLKQPEAQDAGALDLAELRSNPRNADALARAVGAGKSVTQWQSGLAWQSPERSQRASAYVGHRDVTQVFALAPARQRNRPGASADVDLQRQFFGGDWAWRWLDQDRVHSELWLEHQVQLDRRFGYENFTGAAGQEQLGVRGLLKRQEASRTELSGLALVGRAQLAQYWWSDWGWRWNRQSTSLNFLSNGIRDTVRFRAPTGFIAVSVTPSWSEWRDSLTLSAGRGAETPTVTELTNRSDGLLALNPLLASRNDQLELRYRASVKHFSGDVALFAIRSRDELVIVENQAGRAVFDNVQSTRRKGIETQLRWRFQPGQSLHYLGLWQDARYGQDVPLFPGSSEFRLRRDARLPALPTQQHQLQWRQRWGDWRIQFAWQFRGVLVVDDRSQNAIDSEQSWSIAVNRQWRHGRLRSALGLRVDDLFDQQRIAGISINDANARYFDPAEGRSVSVNWRLQW